MRPALPARQSRQYTSPSRSRGRLVRLRDSRPILRRLGIDCEYFPCYVNEKPSFHGIDVVLLSVVLRGEGRHLMEDDVHLERGVSIGVTHYGQSHTIVTGPEGMEIVNVYLDMEKFAPPALPSPLDRALSAIVPLHPNLGNRLNRTVRIEFTRRAQFVRELALQMCREFDSREPGFEESAATLLKQILILCCRQARESGLISSASTRRAALPHIEKVRLHIEGHYAARLTLGELASIAGVTPVHLCRAFKAYTGKSVFAYILDRRVLASMLALRSTDLKVAAVAMDCGFNDMAHFNRVFKSRTGRTPGAYRNYRPPRSTVFDRLPPDGQAA